MPRKVASDSGTVAGPTSAYERDALIALIASVCAACMLTRTRLLQRIKHSQQPCFGAASSCPATGVSSRTLTARTGRQALCGGAAMPPDGDTRVWCSPQDASASARARLLDAGQQEGLQAGDAGGGRQAGDVAEERRAQLPVAVVQECDDGGQQVVVAVPAAAPGARALASAAPAGAPRARGHSPEHGGCAARPPSVRRQPPTRGGVRHPLLHTSSKPLTSWRLHSIVFFEETNTPQCDRVVAALLSLSATCAAAGGSLPEPQQAPHRRPDRPCMAAPATPHKIARAEAPIATPGRPAGALHGTLPPPLAERARAKAPTAAPGRPAGAAGAAAARGATRRCCARPPPAR